MKRKAGTKTQKKKRRSPDHLQGQAAKAGQKEKTPRAANKAADGKAQAVETKLLENDSFSNLKRSKTPTCSPKFRKSAAMESNQDAWQRAYASSSLTQSLISEDTDGKLQSKKTLSRAKDSLSPHRLQNNSFLCPRSSRNHRTSVVVQPYNSFASHSRKSMQSTYNEVLVESMVESEPIACPRTTINLGKPNRAIDYSHAVSEDSEDKIPFQLVDNVKMEASDQKQAVNDLDSPQMQFIENRRSDRKDQLMDDLVVDVPLSGIQLSDTDLLASSVAASALSLKSPLLPDHRDGLQAASDARHAADQPTCKSR